MRSLDRLETCSDFSPFKVRDFYQQRGWTTEIIRVSNVDLRSTDRGAALECADGRSDQLPNRKKYGPKILGGIHAISALRTGGNRRGRELAVELVESLGFKPGTHGAQEPGGCGAFELYQAGKIHVPFPLKERLSTAEIKAEMKRLGGMHATLPGLHVEEAVRFNPFMNTTERGLNGDRFRYDDWFMAVAGIYSIRRLLFLAEIVEQLKPDAKKMEILVP